jgi:GT2 family glycosyltransferase
MAKATAIIPTKSNFNGLKKIVSILGNDDGVQNIVVIADGNKAYNSLKDYPNKHPKVILASVDEGVGIHAMWNIGLNVAQESNTHALLINDDVESDADCASVICDVLDSNKNIGLVCPNYDNRDMPEYQEVSFTCGGRYDGTGGLAGFYMGFRNDLVPKFKFDEEMKWWYGDDDIINWTTFKNYKTVITSLTNCWGNESKTIANDPPANFDEHVKTDRELYKLKVFIRNTIGK